MFPTFFQSKIVLAVCHKTYFVSIFVKMILMVNIITFGQTSKEGITKAIITLETEIILYQKYNITSETITF